VLVDHPDAIAIRPHFGLHLNCCAVFNSFPIPLMVREQRFPCHFRQTVMEYVPLPFEACSSASTGPVARLRQSLNVRPPARRALPDEIVLLRTRCEVHQVISESITGFAEKFALVGEHP